MAAPRLDPNDFDIDGGQPLGCGAISVVNRCVHKPSGRVFAIKVLSKLQLLSLKKVEGVMGEKNALYALGPHAGIPYLHGTMQTDDELFFVMDLLPNGDLLEHIRRVAGTRRMDGADLSTVEPLACMTLKDTQLVTAQLILALSHVFRRGYVLRDLKPENVAFDADGRCVIIDFDTVLQTSDRPVSNEGYALASERPNGPGEVPVTKVSQIQAARRQSSAFCGTAHYVSPEAFGENKYSYASDLFALGGVVYHMLAGRPLFNGASSFFVMKDIKLGVGRKTFPRTVSQHAAAEDFIRRLCEPDPARRLGVDPDTGAFREDLLRAHPFLSGVDWESVAYPPVPVRQPLAALSAEERQSSKRPRYDDDPFHTDEYAQYVLQSGDSAFERFAAGEGEGPAEPEPAVAADDEQDDDSDAATPSADPPPAPPAAAAAAAAAADDDDDDDDDDVVSIEDDVGISETHAEWRGGLAADDAATD